MRSLPFFALGLLAAVACTPKAAPETDPSDEPPAQAAAVAPAALAPAADPADMMGILSEEEFKALHVLRTDAPPTLLGEDLTVAGAKAYLSLPPGAKGPMPGIVLVHEWWGLNDHIKHWADRLAADGYAALAVDLYGGSVAEDPDQAMALMKAVDPERALAILVAADQLLTTDPRVMAPRTGSIGWCFGGGWSLQLALAAPDLDAAVMYYGRTVDDPAALAPMNAHLLGVFANLDQGIPPAAVDAFDAALTQAGKTHQILRFDADHAFANPSGARYDEEDAAKAWEAVRAFFARELKG